MGERIKHCELVERWRKKMPKFFRRVMWLCICIAGTATGVHVYFNHFGITPHEWWTDILPYVTGIPVGAAIACKLTVDGGFRQKQMDKIENTILEKDDF